MTSLPERALVLGATGHLGASIVRELLARGVRVTAVSRGVTQPRGLDELAGEPLERLHGDVDDAGFLERAVAGHGLVVDAAAPYLGRARAVQTRAVESAERARRIVAAAARHGARLAHVSSFVTRVSTDAAGHQLGARARLEERLHPYFASKRAGEGVFLDAARAGMPVVVVNPTLCLGPWDVRPRALCFLPRALGGELPVLPSHLVNVVDVRDVARALVEAVARDMAGRPLLVAGHNAGLPELCSLAADWAHEPARPRGVPVGLSLAASWVAELGTLLSALPDSPLLPMLLVARHVPLVVSHEQRLLGAAPRPLSTTLKDALSWYRQIGYC